MELHLKKKDHLVGVFEKAEQAKASDKRGNIGKQHYCAKDFDLINNSLEGSTPYFFGQC